MMKTSIEHLSFSYELLWSNQMQEKSSQLQIWYEDKEATSPVTARPSYTGLYRALT